MGVSTPQPFRAENAVRNSWESELWDDHLACIYISTTASVVIPMRVNGRIEVSAQVNTLAAGNLVILIDSIAQPFIASVPGAQTVSNLAVSDLTPGIHTVTITSTGGIDTSLIKVRRGRKPV